MGPRCFLSVPCDHQFGPVIIILIAFPVCSLLCLLACAACLDMAFMAPADSYDIQHMSIYYWRMIASSYMLGWYYYEQFKKRAANPVEAQVNMSMSRLHTTRFISSTFNIRPKKQLRFCRRNFQMHFIEWNYLNFIVISVFKISSLVQIAGDKPW